MLVEIPRTDGVGQPVLVPGNPVKMSAVAGHAEHRPPWLGEHTAAVLSAELGLTPAEIEELRSERQQVRGRIEKLLGHIDQLGSAT